MPDGFLYSIQRHHIGSPYSRKWAACIHFFQPTSYQIWMRETILSGCHGAVLSSSNSSTTCPGNSEPDRLFKQPAPLRANLVRGSHGLWRYGATPRDEYKRFAARFRWISPSYSSGMKIITVLDSLTHRWTLFFMLLWHQSYMCWCAVGGAYALTLNALAK